MKCLYVYNKVDMISIEDMDKLAREPNSIVVSVHMKLNLEALLVRMGTGGKPHAAKRFESTAAIAYNTIA